MKWKALALADLDGTLLTDEKQVSRRDRQTLLGLPKKHVVRTAATGRPVEHILSVTGNELPLDYVIFSSGAGIMKWHSRKIIYNRMLSPEEINRLYHLLMKHDLSFAVQKPIPHNHYFYYKINGISTTDFLSRCERYASYAEPLPEDHMPLKAASQFLVTFNTMEDFNRIAEEIDDLQVIRATSPVDFKTIWMEIFPKSVSKGHTAQWLAKHLQIDRQHTFAIGNDYNDLHMLQWAAHSYVVENAPEELKLMFRKSDSNQESGFTTAIRHFLQINGINPNFTEHD